MTGLPPASNFRFLADAFARSRCSRARRRGEPRRRPRAATSEFSGRRPGLRNPLVALLGLERAADDRGDVRIDDLDAARDPHEVVRYVA